MSRILIIMGVFLLALGGTTNMNSLRKRGYSSDDWHKGCLPLDGSIIEKTATMLILTGWGCVIIGATIFAFSFF